MRKPDSRRSPGGRVLIVCSEGLPAPPFPRQILLLIRQPAEHQQNREPSLNDASDQAVDKPQPALRIPRWAMTISGRSMQTATSFSGPPQRDEPARQALARQFSSRTSNRVLRDKATARASSAPAPRRADGRTGLRPVRARVVPLTRQLRRSTRSASQRPDAVIRRRTKARADFDSAPACALRTPCRRRLAGRQAAMQASIDFLDLEAQVEASDDFVRIEWIDVKLPSSRDPRPACWQLEHDVKERPCSGERSRGELMDQLSKGLPGGHRFQGCLPAPRQQLADVGSPEAWHEYTTFRKQPIASQLPRDSARPPGPRPRCPAAGQ